MKYIIKLLNYLLDLKDILFLQTVVSIAFRTIFIYFPWS